MSYMEIPEKHTPDGMKKIPTNCLWLDTFYWSFPWDFNQANVKDCVRSERLEISLLDSLFFLKVQKESETSVSVQLLRVVNKNIPDDGYVLRFILSVVGLQKRPIHAYMTSLMNCLSVPFNVDPNKVKNACCWIVKCYCEMCEMHDLDNNAFKSQNKIIQIDIKKMDRNNLRKFSSMAAMMKRKNFDNILSGRQTNKFAVQKTSIIDRTIEYADDILYVLSQGGGMGINVKYELVPQMLGFICEEEFRSIDDKGIVFLFAMAYRYGLWYLQLLCRDYMKEKLLGICDIVNVLVICDVLCHESGLTNRLVEQYFRRRMEITSHKKWKDLNPCLSSSITDTFLCKSIEEISSLKDKDMQERAEMVSRFAEALEIYNAIKESLYEPVSGMKARNKSQKKE